MSTGQGAIVVVWILVAFILTAGVVMTVLPGQKGK